MTVDIDPDAIADEIARDIDALATHTTQHVRAVRREHSRRLRDADGAEVLAIADALTATHRWVAYELVYNHRGAAAAVDRRWVTQLGRGLDGWASVDAFARYISGPAWRRRQIPDDLVRGWASSAERWWRRAAVVSTVPLNLRAAGGDGDTTRTLDICTRVVDDHDVMVVKALSWALRELVTWDRDAVHAFLDDHHHVLAARVRREVTNKLETGRKDRVPRTNA